MTGNTANTLTTARTILVNLAATAASSFNGSANITPGVSGILPVARGGTGKSTGGTVGTSSGAVGCVWYSSSTSAGFVLPAGGTWRYICFRCYTDRTPRDAYAGSASGGSTVFPLNGLTIGFAIRVA